MSTTISTRKRSWSYGWPVKPFNRQHPVRGFFNDPRIAPGGGRSFHFGIDVSAPDNTPVYAVESGTVHFDNPEAIAVVARDWSHSFGYWHIVPVVKNGQWVERHQLLGRIGAGWEHVHLAEFRGRQYVNPLRNGGIGPYVDPTAPEVDSIKVVGSNLIVVAHDTTYPRVPGRWADEPVTPVLIRWRVGNGSWHIGVDFRATLHSQSEFPLIYTPATLQNRRGTPGTYSFYAARGWTATGTYRITVEATDTAGNGTVATVRIAS